MLMEDTSLAPATCNMMCSMASKGCLALTLLHGGQHMLASTRAFECFPQGVLNTPSQLPVLDQAHPICLQLLERRHST